MIGHHDEFVQSDSGKVVWNRLPAIDGNPSSLAQSHNAVNEVSEESSAATSNDGDKIGSSPRIIIAGNAMTILMTSVHRKIIDQRPTSISGKAKWGPRHASAPAGPDGAERAETLNGE
jgi:hypothetical protein